MFTSNEEACSCVTSFPMLRDRVEVDPHKSNAYSFS